MDDPTQTSDAGATDDPTSTDHEPTPEEQATDRLIADIAPAGSGLDDDLDHAVGPIVISTLRTLSE
jgi:hypothetical protein